MHRDGELLPRERHGRPGSDAPGPGVVAGDGIPADDVDPRADRGEARVGDEALEARGGEPSSAAAVGEEEGDAPEWIGAGAGVEAEGGGEEGGVEGGEGEDGGAEEAVEAADVGEGGGVEDAGPAAADGGGGGEGGGGEAGEALEEEVVGEGGEGRGGDLQGLVVGGEGFVVRVGEAGLHEP